jgi:hypothetical protein
MKTTALVAVNFGDMRIVSSYPLQSRSVTRCFVNAKPPVLESVGHPDIRFGSKAGFRLTFARPISHYPHISPRISPYSDELTRWNRSSSCEILSAGDLGVQPPLSNRKFEEGASAPLERHRLAWRVAPKFLVLSAFTLTVSNSVAAGFFALLSP